MKTCFVTVEEIRPLRNQVLRPGRPIETVYYPCDQLQDCFHVGVKTENKVIATATFYPDILSKEYQKFLPPSLRQFDSTPKVYRLRGMASDPNYRGKGLGKLVLNFAYEELIRRNTPYIWCNARVVAIGFYEKLGYQIIGEEFQIPDIGGHFIAYKNLTQN